MNREIKFRAWHKTYKKMFKIGQLTLEKGSWNYEPKDKEFIGMSIPYQPDFILMQYTGLKDKNGIDIYEGDVVRIIYDNIEHIYQIIFDKEELDFKATNGEINYGGNFQYLGCCEEIEIIGNIYENEVD